MKRKKIFAIILVFIILIISSVLSYAENTIVFDGGNNSGNSSTGGSVPDKTNNGNNNNSNSELPKTVDWHAPTPNFHKYKVDKSSRPCTINIPLKTTVQDLLDDITITLIDDDSGKEWNLLDLQPTYTYDKTYNAMDGKVSDTLPTFAGYTEEGRYFGIAIVNNNGKLLKQNEYIGTGSKIQYSTGDLLGELNVSSIQKVASVSEIKVDVVNNFKISENASTSPNDNSTTCIIKGDITGDGMSNIYDITGLISEIYDKPEDHEWDYAVRKAAILTKENKETPDIYDIQQLIKDNFDK